MNAGDKFEEISLLVRGNEFDAFAVTETWLNDRVSSDCLQITGTTLLSDFTGTTEWVVELHSSRLTPS